MYIIMFSKAKTEAERQKIFDDYFLTLLKKKEVIKRNQKIIDEQGGLSFDPTIDENKMKGAFDSYVDSLVVKNFLIEQIYTRLKISKSMAMNFVNKLDGNQVLILSKVVNNFIDDIKQKYVSINDYILKTSFDELQTNYNVIQQQEKNKDIIKQNQEAQTDILQDNIPAEGIAGRRAEESDEDFYDTEDETNQYSQLSEEKQKMMKFLNDTIFKLVGVRGFNVIALKRTILAELSNDPSVYDVRITNKELDERIMGVALEDFEDSEEESVVREEVQFKLFRILSSSESIPKNVRKNNERIIEKMSRIISGSGYKMRGSGYGIHNPVKDEYIPIGKYKAHKAKLMGGQLQMRSNNNYQIHNLKTQNITKNIRDILLKLHKDEPIKFHDIDKLNTEEKDQLYNIGKKLHITQLFDIPSTLKSQEDKLKDEFQLLRGSLVAGNNNPDLLRKFKIVLLKMKNKKLVSLQEYNEVLNILLEMEI